MLGPRCEMCAGADPLGTGPCLRCLVNGLANRALPAKPFAAPAGGVRVRGVAAAREAIENILDYVRNKDDLYANGAIRQFAEEARDALADGVKGEGNG